MKPAPLYWGEDWETCECDSWWCCSPAVATAFALQHPETPPAAGAAPGSAEKSSLPEHTRQEWKRARNHFPTGRVGQGWSRHPLAHVSSPVVELGSPARETLGVLKPEPGRAPSGCCWSPCRLRKAKKRKKKTNKQVALLSPSKGLNISHEATPEPPRLLCPLRLLHPPRAGAKVGTC